MTHRTFTEYGAMQLSNSDRPLPQQALEHSTYYY
jgi:hypothetical protein